MTRARTTPPFDAVALIRQKRDGGRHAPESLRALIEAYAADAVPDYQMAAWAMAVYQHGMTIEETTALTLAMRDSGLVFERGGFGGRAVDKHSTGGVGDKVSLCLAPMVAACSVRVPMICGRGLGHTGGTVDKLEAIPGYRTDLPPRAFRAQVRKLGLAIIGQTEALAPADRRLYALRDVTGTVESIPLITASILSKKLAEGIDALVLDVKVGGGAFMATEKDARALARSLADVGRRAGVEVTALLTSMDAPLGRTIGNALETAEAFEVLGGGGPEDVRQLSIELGVEMLRLAGVAERERDAREALENVLRDGRALRRMEQVVEAQGGDPRVVGEPDRLPKAKHRVPVVSARAGYVTAVDAMALALCSVELGAGRLRKEQTIDPTVGLTLEVRVGDRVAAGAPLATIHAQSSGRAAAIADRVLGAFRVAKKAPAASKLVLGRVRR